MNWKISAAAALLVLPLASSAYAAVDSNPQASSLSNNSTTLIAQGAKRVRVVKVRTSPKVPRQFRRLDRGGLNLNFLLLK